MVHTASTGPWDCSDRGPHGIAVAVPAGGWVRILSIDWTGYLSPGDPQDFRTYGNFEDAALYKPPNPANVITSLGADLGHAIAGGTIGNEYNHDASKGPIGPDVGPAHSGEAFNDRTGSGEAITFECGNNPYFESVGSWSFTITWTASTDTGGGGGGGGPGSNGSGATDGVSTW